MRKLSTSILTSIALILGFAASASDDPAAARDALMNDDVRGAVKPIGAMFNGEAEYDWAIRRPSSPRTPAMDTLATAIRPTSGTTTAPSRVTTSSWAISTSPVRITTNRSPGPTR